MDLVLNSKTFDIAYRPNTSDSVVIAEAQDDIYHLASLVERGQEWIDAGANIGTSTLSILAYGGNVLAGLEPDLANFRLYRDNVARAGYFDVPTFNKGLTPPGLWRFENTGSEPWHYKFSPVDNPDEAEQNVVELAELVASVNRPCLKMDIEGLEQEIIMNTPLYDLAKLEVIVMEYHHDRHTDAEFLALVDRLQRAGFLVAPEPVTADHKELVGAPYILTAYKRLPSSK